MIATRESYGNILIELGKENKDIVVLDADLSKSTKTAGFAKHFPKRFINAGIAEQNLMGMAAGLATTGKIPFASTFAVFATGRAFEIIRNSICYPKLNVKIAATHAGITVGEDGGSHQSIEDIAIMRSLPNMKIIVPADDVETRQAVRAAAHIDGPVYLRLGRLGVPPIFDESHTFTFGKGNVLKDGKDITIIGMGLMISKCLKAAELLKQEGISARVINISTIKPIDEELIIQAAKETKRILTVEEHSVIGGLGSAVCDVLSTHYPVQVVKIGMNDTFGESGKPEELLTKYGLTVENIYDTAQKTVNSKK
ncbi:transketolase [Pelosinus fermentans]|uniref:Transketolase central region n=1 Tax=Pelosinus fermentans B4 TaxID=1149862 RepID=I8RH54_9FIRM|nr:MULTISPECIES: transketolase family protein [Pelosinus]EIW19028.1 Transketolase central region [Pelosinus fermentans B4]OAM95390.1 1-deoxy-D-xylulose-5-phosphate synthase [Pelosinus fermentans DSM 17108]SDR27411.1 transketolase [Pelosinus fermentans]